MSIVPSIQIAAGIRRLEGLWEGPDEPVFAPESVFGRNIGLIRLNALSCYWEQPARGPQSLFHRQARLLAGLSGNAIPWVYVALAEDGNVSVCLGLPARKDVFCRAASCLPDRQSIAW